MDLETLIKNATSNLEKMKADNEKLMNDINALNEKNTELKGEIDKLKEAGDQDGVKQLAAQIEEHMTEIDEKFRKLQPTNTVMTEEEKQKVHSEVLKPVIGKWMKGKQNNTAPEFFKFIETGAKEQFKTLNITNPDEGGRAIAEILSRDVIEYAREYSPVLSQVGRKPSMTRNFRELVLVSYPSVAEGIENVAGTDFAETTTQEYKEVKSKEFKVSAKPRITDEAMYGTDINVYADLIRLLGREIGIYLAAQVLFGNGTGKNARGILSSNRVDITNLTGESWKPTLAPDPANARNADYFPAVATSVSGSLGATDTAIVDFIIDLVNLLPTQWLNGARFHMNRKTKGVLEKVRTSDDKPIFINSFMEGGQLMLMGYPVVIDDTLPDLAADSTPIIFGNLAAAYAINDGDIDKMLIDPYTVDDCTVVKYSKEMFEIIQNSDAILVVAATTNGPA
ncbi:major capsid protein [Vibrio phage Artemius]|nr:major capsid protein [Vibrio phage Artemius]